MSGMISARRIDPGRARRARRLSRAPAAIPVFLQREDTAEKRMAKLRETAGLLRDQFALLRTLGANASYALTDGAVSRDERKRIAGLLDECIGEIGNLIGKLNGSAK